LNNVTPRTMEWQGINNKRMVAYRWEEIWIGLHDNLQIGSELDVC